MDKGDLSLLTFRLSKFPPISIPEAADDVMDAPPNHATIASPEHEFLIVLSNVLWSPSGSEDFILSAICIYHSSV